MCVCEQQAVCCISRVLKVDLREWVAEWNTFFLCVCVCVCVCMRACVCVNNKQFVLIINRVLEC